MRFVDVNVLVYAHRRESNRHDRYREWLEAARSDIEPLGVADVVLAGFLRVVTNPRIFQDPTETRQALMFAEQLRSSPAYLRAEPSPNVWDRVRELAATTSAKGNAIPDVYLAAAAIDLNATLVTADRGFARFADLRWQHPLD